MKEFTKSLFSYSLALSLFGLKQFDNMLRPSGRGERKGPATKAFDSVASATTQQLGSTLNTVFRAADSFQRGLVELTFTLLFPFGGRETRRASAEDASAPARDPVVDSAEPQLWTDVMERRTGTR